ncbi:MAG: zinc-dependent metalloprotease [Roseimicrobium sp.]
MNIATCLTALATLLAVPLTAQTPPQPAPMPTPAPQPTAPKPTNAGAKAQALTEKPKPPAPVPSTVAVKKKTVAEVIKNSDTMDGLFRLHRDRETGLAHIYIRKEQLDREFIYFSHVVDGVVGADRNRGQFGDELVFRIKRNYEKIEFIQQNTAFYFDPQHPLARAADANLSHAVLAAEVIVAQDGDGFLLSATNLFLKETLRQVKPTTKDEKKAVLGKLSDSKTKFTRLKSFPRNTLITVEYVYENAAPPELGDDDKAAADIADLRNVSVTVQHTLIAMPENDYQPRRDDPRIGYFMTQITDQTSTEATPWRDLIHRWHLVKKDPTAAVSEPVEPITWWIENTTPDEFRPIIREAALKWNLSFEKIGFKNALVILEQPDDAAWDSDDIDHNVLRWTSSPKPPFGGYGPSFVNPRTGQILGSDIMLEFSFVKNRIFARRIWNEVGLLGQTEQNALATDPHACAASSMTQQGLMLGRQIMRLREADKVEFDTMLRESMAQLILHELGHTLGLNHNFRASRLHTPAELQDRALTAKTALSGSVMDYMPLNLSPDKKRQGQYYIDTPGPYDDWAIAYGYSTALPNKAEEERRLNTIAARSYEPQLAFANDADDMRSNGKAIDPRAMIYDMSSDPVAYGTARCEMIRQATDKLLQQYPREGTSWQELTNAYITLTVDAANALNAISRFIGGVEVERPYVGQVKKNAPQPLRPVDAATQRAAMQALAKFAFAADAWAAPETLLSHLQQQRRGFDFRSEGEDPKLHERARKIQTGLLDHLLHNNTQNRILDSALYGNSYQLPAMMRELTDAIANLAELQAPINTQRQNLQLDYVDRLLGIVKGNSKQPAAQSVALFELRRIEKLCANSEGLAPETNLPHLAHVLYKIRRGLEP